MFYAQSTITVISGREEEEEAEEEEEEEKEISIHLLPAAKRNIYLYLYPCAYLISCTLDHIYAQILTVIHSKCRVQPR